MAKAGPDVEVLEFAVAREVEAYYFFMALVWGEARLLWL